MRRRVRAAVASLSGHRPLGGVPGQQDPAGEKRDTAEGGHRPEKAGASEREPVERTGKEHDADAPAERHLGVRAGMGVAPAGQGEERHGVDELIEHRGLPRFEGAVGFQRGLQAVRAEGAERYAEESESCGSESDHAGGASHGDECVDKPRKTNLPFSVVRLSLLLALLLPCARAQWLDDDWTRSLEAKLATKHVEHGVVRAEAGMQPGVRFSSGTLSFAAWMYRPFEQDQGREQTGAVGWSREFAGGLKLEVEGRRRAVRNPAPGHARRITEFSLRLARPCGPGRIEALYLRDVQRRADLGELAFAGERPLPSWGAFLHYRLFAGARASRDILPARSGGCVADAYTYHGAGVSLPYRVGGSMVVTAQADYTGTRGQRPFWSPLPARSGGGFSLSLAATYEF